MAMLKNKITFSLMLVCLIVVSPMAKAQVGGLGGLLGTAVQAVNLDGLVMCSINGRVSTNNATSIPAFPNAGIELRCGGVNVSSTTTNAAGVFSIPLNTLPLSPSTLLSNCIIAVTTPLATCNANLPTAGRLTAPLSLVGTTVSDLLTIIQLVPGIFRLIL